MRPVISNRDSIMPLKAPPSGMPLVILLRVLRAKSRTLDAVRTVSEAINGGPFRGISCRLDFLSLSDCFSVVGTLVRADRRLKNGRKFKLSRKCMMLERAGREEKGYEETNEGHGALRRTVYLGGGTVNGGGR
jgi:hypothetical protein